MTEPRTLRNAVVGAVLTVVLSFTAISPLLGGGLAGYLQRESPKRGLRVGAISGLIASVPFVLVLVLGAGLLLGGAARIGVPGGLELVVILFVMFPLLFAWNVVLSAAGGYVGAALRQGSSPSTGGTPPTELDA